MGGRLFDPDGAFAHVLGVVGELIVLNLLWLLCAVPVVTVGAATVALHASIQRRVLSGDESSMVRRFFPAFRENFRRATAAWLIVLALSALCAFNVYVSRQMESTVLLLASVLGALLLALEVTALFPLLARYENTLGNHIKNALLFSVANLPRVVLLYLLLGGAVAALLTPSLALHALGLWLFIGVSGFAYIATLILRKAFAALESRQPPC